MLHEGCEVAGDLPRLNSHPCTSQQLTPSTPTTIPLPLSSLRDPFLTPFHPPLHCPVVVVSDLSRTPLSLSSTLFCIIILLLLVVVIVGGK